MHSTELTGVEQVTIGVLEEALHGRRGHKQVAVITDAKNGDIGFLAKQIVRRIPKPERRDLSMPRCDLKKAVRAMLEQLKKLNIIQVRKNQWVVIPQLFRKWQDSGQSTDSNRSPQQAKNAPLPYINRPAPSKS